MKWDSAISDKTISESIPEKFRNFWKKNKFCIKREVFRTKHWLFETRKMEITQMIPPTTQQVRWKPMTETCPCSSRLHRSQHLWWSNVNSTGFILKLLVKWPHAIIILWTSTVRNVHRKMTAALPKSDVEQDWTVFPTWKNMAAAMRECLDSSNPFSDC